MTRPDMLGAALAAARHLGPVLYVRQDKTPWHPNGLDGASTDPDVLARGRWRWPSAGIAVRCDRLLAVDVDVKDGTSGLPALLALAEPHGGLPATRVHRTPSGGAHVLYSRPADVLMGMSGRAHDVAPLVDSRFGRNYVVVPPTPGYIVDVAAPLAPPPTWLVDHIERGRSCAHASDMRAGTTRPSDRPVRTERYGLAALDDECATVANTPAGGRNHALNASAYKLGRLVGAGLLDRDVAEDALTNSGLRAGLGGREVKNTVRSGLDAGERNPRKVAS